MKRIRTGIDSALTCSLPGAGKLTVALSFVFLLLLIGLRPAGAQGFWTPQGPGPHTHGQVENLADGEVVGSIQAIAMHPTDPNRLWVGAVNGGVWRTDEGTAASPHWRPLTDDQPSLSIGALELDPTDPTSQTLVAGTGCFSSYFHCSARPAVGLLRTTDGGNRWSVIDGGGDLTGLHISGVAPRGPVLVISVNRAAVETDAGIWRSSDGGASWRQVSTIDGSGLPAGAAPDLTGHRSAPGTLFTSIQQKGLYRSLDAGATWKKVGDTAMSNKVAQAENVRIAMGSAGNVFVATVGPSLRLSGVFRSRDGGTTWTAMALPRTAEGGLHPGAQGGKHLSLAVDPTDPNLVYIGGDTQPTTSQFATPNSIGATDYTGRLFRGDASRPLNRQWVHLTHSRHLGAPGGGTGNGSAPHADSRDLLVALNGDLIEVDDGGIYRRTEPRSNNGIWFSMNGDIQTAELHSVSWDDNFRIVLGGAQDTGTPEQVRPGHARWRSVSGSDGGVVAVEDATSASRSTRYSSAYELLDFRRQVHDRATPSVVDDYPPLAIEGGTGQPSPQFYSPVVVHASDSERLVIGGSHSLYESFNRGESVFEIGPNLVVNPSGGGAVAYGAPGHPEVLYVGAGSRFYARQAGGPAAPQEKAAYPGGTVVDLVLDPQQPATAFTIDPARVYLTPDGGDTWKDVTGNLASLAAGELRSVAYGRSPAGLLVVGADSGVFSATGPAFSSWSRLGSGLPRAPVMQLELDPADGVLVAATLGRGAWTFATAPAPPPPPPPLPPAFAQPAPAAERPAAPDFAALGPPPAEKGDTVFRLQPGIWIDTLASRAYLMAPSGGIEAVDLTSGAEVWRSGAAAKPLGLVDGALVGQGDSTIEDGSAMKVAVLDAVDGRALLARTVELPAGVEPRVEATAESTFEAVAHGEGGDAVIAWEAGERTLRGIHPQAQSVLPPPSPDPTPAPAFAPEGEPAESVRRGAFGLDLRTGAVSAADDPRNFTAVPLNVEGLKARPFLPLGVDQGLSVDGRHAVVSERLAEQDGDNRYRLTFYDRTSGTPLGEMRSRLPVLSFVVSGSRVIFETRSFSRRSGTEGMVTEPRSLRAVDLVTGTEVWRRPVREATYRGPLPP